jgi:hypothetical protein
MQGKVEPEVIELLTAMAGDAATDDRTRKRARAVLSYLATGDITEAAKHAEVTKPTARTYVKKFEETGWQGLITVLPPRGGDFLANYDQGFWAEQLARTYLDNNRDYRAIPYGTSRSKPFTNMGTFRDYAVNEFLLQAWSSGLKWKRPDLLLVPRTLLRKEAGNDEWTPDLIHWDNDRCRPYVTAASAGIEVETSLWQVSRVKRSLSFTVKHEDLEALRAWVSSTSLPLYIFQLFYDEAHVLPFSTLEYLISPEAPPGRQVVAKEDRFTKKDTYFIPLAEGTKVGSVPEPDVEGRVYKADNGKVTVYGKLTGSRIERSDRDVLDKLASGRLGIET